MSCRRSSPEGFPFSLWVLAFHTTLFTSSASRLLFVTYKACWRQTSNVKDQSMDGKEGGFTYTSRAFLYYVVSIS